MRSFVLIFILIPVFAFSCDMIAIIGDITPSIEEYGVNFLVENSGSRSNNDGYGIAWYNSKWHAEFKSGKRRWFGDGDKEALDKIEDWQMGESGYDEVFMLHARDATKGYGNHPFFLELNGINWAFMHNGKINQALQTFMMDYLGDYWFTVHPSNWVDNTADMVDSELFFHYLVSRLAKGADIEEVLSDIAFLEKNIIKKSILNFILSDGTSLYAYKNSGKKDYKHKLSWQLQDGALIVKTDRKLGKYLETNDLLHYRNGEVNLQKIR